VQQSKEAVAYLHKKSSMIIDGEVQADFALNLRLKEKFPLF
jgi:phosphotransacetylase